MVVVVGFCFVFVLFFAFLRLWESFLADCEVGTVFLEKPGKNW